MRVIAPSVCVYWGVKVHDDRGQVLDVGPTGHYGRVVKATDSNSFDYLFPSGSAGSNPAGVVSLLSALLFLLPPLELPTALHDCTYATHEMHEYVVASPQAATASPEVLEAPRKDANATQHNGNHAFSHLRASSGWTSSATATAPRATRTTARTRTAAQAELSDEAPEQETSAPKRRGRIAKGQSSKEPPIPEDSVEPRQPLSPIPDSSSQTIPKKRGRPPKTADTSNVTVPEPAREGRGRSPGNAAAASRARSLMSISSSTSSRIMGAVIQCHDARRSDGMGKKKKRARRFLRTEEQLPAARATDICPAGSAPDPSAPHPVLPSLNSGQVQSGGIR
ncbi:hypothetical protein NUW54_g5061 [Trametes sanguinea]|uniref:Uncharacterized protein n=1 Tax=Trametes sanguinea TaxID=158606 RepID=A0ACC1PWP7_9APHY|nr:hypothetical protein NUW54_g5061 [Trametes sanguinea]